MKARAFFHIDNNNLIRTPEGSLELTARMVDEGEINGDYFSYEELKTMTPFWTAYPITIEHEGHEEGFTVRPDNYHEVVVGTIIKGFDNDLQREVISKIRLTTERGIDAYLKEGKEYVSVGFVVIINADGTRTLIPNHLSLVSNPARPRAKILAGKQIFGGKNMDLEELAQMVANLSEEDLASFLSLLEEKSANKTAASTEDKKEDSSVEASEEDEAKKALQAENDALKAELEVLKKEKEDLSITAKKASDRVKAISASLAKGSLMPVSASAKNNRIFKRKES